jgi:hypothetical protein
MTKSRSIAPIIAAVLLLLPALYVGSFYILVQPGKIRMAKTVKVTPSLYRSGVIYETYRYGGEQAAWFFWPLEQFDRRLRPGAWEPSMLEQVKLRATQIRPRELIATEN